MNINFEDVPEKYQLKSEVLSKALGRPVNLYHERMEDIAFELVKKVEQYQTEYKDTVMAVRKHLVEGQHGK
jgi:hypothetical protein